jgi:hypothetical protein
VVEHVAIQELNATPNITKYRTMAEASLAIFSLLARKTRELALVNSPRQFLFEPGVPDPADVEASGSGDLTREETENLLRNAQAILTVNGTGDDQVMRYAAPSEAISAPSLPQLGRKGGAAADGHLAERLRQMVAANTPPTVDQIRQMLPGMG